LVSTEEIKSKVALTTETKQRKNIQNKSKIVLRLFQRFVHVKQNAETKQK